MFTSILIKVFGAKLAGLVRTFLPFIIIASLLGLGWFYMEKIRAENIILRSSVVKLESAVALQSSTINTMEGALQQWEAAQAQVEETIAEMGRQRIAAATETRRLNNVFSNHDLTSLAFQKPVLVERTINSGSDDIFRLLECATGSGNPDCGSTGSPPE